jgi:hypothetical protein
MDETCVRVKGTWIYLYRAIDKLGKTLDFMLPKRRNKTAATKFFARPLEVNGLPRKIVIDRCGAYTAGINAVNRMLRSFGYLIPIETVRIKYLYTMVEQDHRTITNRIRPMAGIQAFGLRIGNVRRDRSRQNDPQGQDNARPLPVYAIYGTGGLTEEDRGASPGCPEVCKRTRRDAANRRSALRSRGRTGTT